MTTVADLVAKTQRHLLGQHRERYNRLTSLISSSATEITCDFSIQESGVTRGSIIAIEDELLYVIDQTASQLAANKATVIRGFRGSTAAEHTSGQLIHANPRFPVFLIKDALKAEIASWPAGLYREVPVDVAIGSVDTGYNFAGAPTTWYSAVDYLWSPSTGAGTTAWTSLSGVHVERGLPTTSYASGAALFLDRALSAGTVRVILSAPFDLTTFADTTVVETTIGIPASAVDIAPLGAAAQLLSTREAPRTNAESQGQPRSAEEVPPMFISQAAARLRAEADRRIGMEAFRLMARRPMRVG